MQIKLLAEGGAMKPGPALSQQLGPLGVNISQVIEKVNEATVNFKGIKVPVELDVNTKTKKFEIKVFSPPVSEGSIFKVKSVDSIKILLIFNTCKLLLLLLSSL